MTAIPIAVVSSDTGTEPIIPRVNIQTAWRPRAVMYMSRRSSRPTTTCQRTSAKTRRLTVDGDTGCDDVGGALLVSGVCA